MAILLVLIALIFPCLGEVNLYLKKQEVYRVFGFDGDLYYIRDGIENWNAIQYQMILSENIETLKFTWKDSRSLSLVVLPTLYSMSLSHTGDALQGVGIIDKKTAGQIPTLGEADFTLGMKCKEGIQSSSLIHFAINITSVLPHQTNTKNKILNFTFKKFCSPVVHSPQVIEDDSIPITNYNEDEDDLTVKEDVITVYVIVAFVCTVIVGFASFTLYLHIKSMPTEEDEEEDNLAAKEQSIANEEVTNLAITKALKAAAAEKQLKELIMNLKDFAIPRNLLSIFNTTQEGSFGRVYVGNMINAESGEESKVMIKTVTEQASVEQTTVFLSESSYLKRTLHHNVLPLMHVCFEDKKPPMVIYPYMNRGNLKNYLRLSRTVEPLSKPLTTRDIVLMSLQISRGLQYLYRRRLIHKDVATRNCVIDEELHVKICDNSLSRDFFPGDYHCIGENENRPIRWMAVESLENNTYLHASDVWSYGVLLWELSSLAQTPYANVDPLEMLKYLKSGLRLPQPAQCPDDFFTVMACCWALSPEERPHFTQIMACLDAFLNTLNAFI